MSNDYQVKTINFGSILVNGSVRADLYAEGGQSFTGEILKIKIANPISPGSIWFTESGGAIFATHNNIVSGAAVFEWYPRKYTTENLGNAAINVGSLSVPTVISAPISVAASGLTSGTGKYFGPVTVYYR